MESDTGNNCSAVVSVTVAAVTPPVAGGVNKMYWTDLRTEKIQRSNLDGSGVQDLVTTGLGRPAGIALDVSGGKMYWTDLRTEKIQRSNLDGSGVQDLVTTGLGRPAGIAFGCVRRQDVLDGFWTRKRYSGPTSTAAVSKTSSPQDWSTQAASCWTCPAARCTGRILDTDKIQWSNLDGSGVQDLVTTGLGDPSGIALDVSGGKMYWTDGVTDKIQRSNLDGSGVQDLVTTGLEIPFGIALDVSGGKMYWTDWGTEKIQRSNLDGSGVEDLVTTGSEIPYGIALGLTPAEAGKDLVVPGIGQR